MILQFNEVENSQVSIAHGFPRVGSTTLISQLFILLYKIQHIVGLVLHVRDPKGQGFLTFGC